MSLVHDLKSRELDTKTIRSLPPVKLEGLTHRDLLDYFTNTWELYELLFGAIESDDSLYQNPDPLRHSLILTKRLNRRGSATSSRESSGNTGWVYHRLPSGVTISW